MDPALTHAPTKRSASLDGLRGIAVLAVLGYHAHYGWLGGGFLGVDMFFVLSGYLITRGLVRNRGSYLGFLGRRAARLAPALLVMLTLLAVATAWLGPDADRQRLAPCTLASGLHVMNLPFAESLLCSAPWHITWSLAAEEQFYLFWPLLLGLLLTLFRRRSLVVAGLTTLTLYGGGLAWQAFLRTGEDVRTARVLYAPDGRSLVVLLGCALALLTFARPRGVRWPAPAVALTGLVAAFVLCPLGSGWPAFAATIGVGVGTAVLIAASTAGRLGAVGWVLTRPALVLVGRMSYSLYLWHEIAYRLVELAAPRGSLTCELLRWPVTLLLGALSYRLVERPAQRGLLDLGHRLQARRAVRAEALDLELLALEDSVRPS